MRVDCDVRLHDRFNEFIETTADKKKSVVIGILDEDIATYATYVEYGWTKRVTFSQQKNFFEKVLGEGNGPKVGARLIAKPRPFMRSTMESKAGEWFAKFAGYLKTYGLDRLEDAFTEVGTAAQQDIQATIENGGVEGGESFPERKPLTMAIYAALSGNRKVESDSLSGRTKPLMRTSDMYNAISFQIE